ncbi:MAG: type II secretion system inner membrane protein GspF [Pseudomonadota bacterium]
MPAFEYEALDGDGKSRRGVVSADTARLARQELRRLRLTPVAINTASERAFLKTGGAKAPARISRRQLSAVTRQLAVLLGAGAPLEEALGAIGLQADDVPTRKRLLAVRERVTEGWRFADALGEDKKSFPELYRSVVAAGEMSGDLAPVLDRLATMLEKNRAMQSKALGSLIYPAALIVFAGGVVSALMTVVVPKIVVQFEVFDTQLPLLTRMVIGVSEFLASFGLLILGALALGCVALWQGLRNENLRRAFDKNVLKIPVLGRLMRALDGARFARTLSTLVAGGAPLLDALRGAQRTVGNAFMRDRLDGAITQVREGGHLAAALKRADVLPPMMIHMVAAGERAGAVPALLDKSAEQMEEEFDTASTVALRLLEPSIIVLMGGVVAIIVVSIMLPIMQLNQLAAG